MKLFYLIFPVQIQNSKNFYVFAHDTREFVLDQEMTQAEISEWLVGKRVMLVNSTDVAQHFLFNRLPRFPLPSSFPRSYECNLIDIRSSFFNLFLKDFEYDDLIYKNETNNLDNQGLLLYVHDPKGPRFLDIYGNWSSDIFGMISKINIWNVFVCGNIKAMPADLKRTVEWRDDPTGVITFARIQNKGNVSPMRIRYLTTNSIDAYYKMVGPIEERVPKLIRKDHSDDTIEFKQTEFKDILGTPLEYSQDTVTVPRWAALVLLRTAMNLCGGDLSDEILLGSFDTDRLMNIVVDKSKPGFYRSPESYVPPLEDPNKNKIEAYHGYPSSNIPKRPPSPTYMRQPDTNREFFSAPKSLIGSSVASPPSSHVSQSAPVNLIDACKIALKSGPRFLSEVRATVSALVDRRLTNSDMNRVLYNNKDLFHKREDGSWSLV